MTSKQTELHSIVKKSEKSLATEVLSEEKTNDSVRLINDTAPKEIKENAHILDDHFDVGYAYSISKLLLKFINEGYFRIKFVGFDKIPERNNPDAPIIYASNHSGMAFPWDAIAFVSGLFDKTDYDLQNSVRAITAPALSRSQFMNPFTLKNFWKKLGAIDATWLNYETAMHYNGSNILVYPEGVPGIGKGFNNKYSLQRLATSTLRMSIKYKTDIVPFATVNGEYINPFSYSVSLLNDFVQKLGIPFLPIGVMTTLIPIQPWMFYFAFPANLTFVRGKRISPYKMVGERSIEDISEEEIYALSEEIHDQMQIELDKAVAIYGQKPYDLMDLLSVNLKDINRAFKFFPALWPIVFKKHSEDFKSLRKELEENGGYSKDAQEQLDIVRPIVDQQKELDVSLSSVVDTIVENPEILLFYTPIAGLLHIFSSK
ncbi:lysophospholipid acyltransferase family protein [Flammeovirga agarivorans]|uniref:Glycerol acyltransferase n=1 Tax=Flammeovirga agarivorans TaxID=2726742 RepID=A0A7X8XW42_9BACT|nr:glycerol acyltransferase [Flammeovirga agarivorans]NLR91891.1 glycerol acyltransferase [Flammeovirga agarivorans]